MRKNACLALLLLIYLFPLLTSAAIPSSKQRVLVLHSFHKGQKWNDDLSRGIESRLKIDGVELNFEYMDAKRYLDDRHMKNLVRLYRHKYQTRKVDVVISTDERALDFLLTYRGDLFPNASVVFTGIKSYEEDMLFGEKKLTGVIESVDIRSNVRLALQLNPKLKRMLIIVDNSPTSLATISAFLPVVREFSSRISFRFTDFVAMEELQKKLEELPQDNAVFLVNYTKDKNGHIFSMNESARLITGSSPVPVYTLWDAYMGKGILGGRLISGYIQGKKAAEITLGILQGERPEQIPVQTNLSSQYIFDYKKLKEFNIKLSKLPRDSVILNQPYTFYQQYKKLIFSVLAGGISLSLIILVLSLNIMRRRRVEKSLKKYSQRLTFLHRMDQAILNTFSIENIAEDILRPALDLFDCDLIGIFLFEKGHPQAKLLLLRKVGNESSSEELAIPLDWLPMEDLGAGAIWSPSEDAKQGPDFLSKIESFASFKSSLLTPLMFQSKLLGTLFLGSTREKAFGWELEKISRQVADSLAIAVQNEHWLKEIRGHEAELRRMSINILDAQENERKHLSAELHDEFGQTLTAIGLNLRVIRKKIENTCGMNVLNRMEETEESIERLSEQVHDLSLDLRPPMLDDLGLVPTLRWFLYQYGERSGLEVDFSVLEKKGTIIPGSVSVTMYRVLQEAFTNVTKYAQASKVTVHLEVTTSEIKLLVSDDGIGFDLHEVRSRDLGIRGLGLVGMRERLELLEGVLKIQSIKNRGTTLQATVPLKSQ